MRDLDKIVHLHWNIALPYAAEQNFIADVRKNIIKPDRWKYEHNSYIGEVMELMMHDGYNHYHDDIDLPYIAITTTGKVDEINGCITGLMNIFDFYYANFNKKRNIERPDPRIHNTYQSIINITGDLYRTRQSH